MTKPRPANRGTSVAVIARRAEPSDSLDFFPTPPWATRALCEYLLPVAWPWPNLFSTVPWDPACGEGHMAGALSDYFGACHASDIFGYGFGQVSDFLNPEPAFLPEADWIVTNPPFNRGVDFVEAALKRARLGVAMLVRTQFAEGQDRFKRLFRHRPPQIDAQFVERVPMHRGRWVVNGKSATAYTWMVWLNMRGAEWMVPRRMWIPPCRAKLTRPDDWLRFGGCQDIPKKHAVTRELEKLKKPAAGTTPPTAQMADVRRELEAML